MRSPQVVDQYPFPPGSCVVCQSQNAPGIDTMTNYVLRGMDAGRCYVCGRCVGTFASLLGYVDPESAGALELEIARLKENQGELERELAQAREEQVKVVPLADLAEAVAARREQD